MTQIFAWQIPPTKVVPLNASSLERCCGYIQANIFGLCAKACAVLWSC